MEASVLLFCCGAVLGAILLAGVVWPTRTLLQSYVSPPQSKLFLVSSCFISILVALFVIYLALSVSQGYYSLAGTDEHRTFVFLTSPYVSQFSLGLFMGPILFYWLHYYSKRKPSTLEKSNHAKLTITICVFTLFSLFLPYAHRWLANASSFEISQIGKITIDSRQSPQAQNSSFISSLSTASAGGEFKGYEILYALEEIVKMGENDPLQGMIKRDNYYLTKVQNRNKIFPEDDRPSKQLPGKRPIEVKDPQVPTAKQAVATDSPSPNPELANVEHQSQHVEVTPVTSVGIEAQTLADEKFLQYLAPLAKCLHKYAEEFQDYRLFLVDVKPVILSLTQLAKLDDNSSLKTSYEYFTENVRQLRSHVMRAISHRSNDVQAVCTEEPKVALSDLPEFGSRLPYKTIALSFFLAAVGAPDTAVVELAEWLRRNSGKVPSWYEQRAQIQLSILLEKAMPGGFRNPTFRRFMDDHIRELEGVIPVTDVVKWADKCREASILDAQLVFTYMTQVNIYVKASSNLDDISSEIVRMAEQNKNADLDCFDKLGYISKEKDGWRAEFLTSYAYALIVSSYDERLFGQTDHPERKRLREIARKDLYDAMNHLKKRADREKQSEKQNEQPLTAMGAKAIFSRENWESTRMAARTAMRSIFDESQ
jgi:hypothetical protein